MEKEKFDALNIIWWKVTLAWSRRISSRCASCIPCSSAIGGNIWNFSDSVTPYIKSYLHMWYQQRVNLWRKHISGICFGEVSRAWAIFHCSQLFGDIDGNHWNETRTSLLERARVRCKFVQLGTKFEFVPNDVLLSRSFAKVSGFIESVGIWESMSARFEYSWC